MVDDDYKIQIQSDQNPNSQSNLITNENSNSMSNHLVNNDNEKVIKYE